ncbi:hypothetical protein FTX61_15525 [Nitriliruptoraceae bacterium ZYF776]|nr:hypothetical protein [Profundirhabdus halotolerans]
MAPWSLGGWVVASLGARRGQGCAGGALRTTLGTRARCTRWTRRSIDEVEVAVATYEEVESVLETLLQRLHTLDPSLRSLLPARRTIEARCPDLDLVRWALWREGALELLAAAPDRRADIRIAVDSDDLLKLHRGELTFSRAYASNRVRLDASMTDLIRLRAVL